MRGVALATGVVALAIAGFFVAAASVPRAAAHNNPCHSQHACPSDHHTYVWTDPSTGLSWDCAEPGAREYDPSLDTTTIVWDGLSYYCRAVGDATTTTATTATTGTSTSTTATTTTTTAQVQLVLPDPSLTPGAFNPKVRQATIQRTICRSGWTKRIRPPVSYTNGLKLEQMTEYGETGSPSDYEEDHFIPLELGGAPRNPTNLWPEPRAQSQKSDPLETSLKRAVCRHTLSLKSARLRIRAFKFANG
jgi:hypothetical protein